MEIESTVPNKPKRSFFALIVRGTVVLVFFLLLIFSVLTALFLVYEKEIKASILKELNKHLLVEVKVKPENIDVTFIRSFPKCALEFKEVLVLEAAKTAGKDSLLFARRLALSFDLADIWHKKYDIHTIIISEGVIKLKEDKYGKTNYDFWKEEAAAETGGSTAFDLEKVKLEKMRVSYKNAGVRFKMDFFLNAASFEGHFNDKSYQLRATAKMLMNEMKKDKTLFLRKKEMDLDFDFAVNDDHYTINSAQIRINELLLNLNGQLVYKEELESLVLGFDAPDLSIAPALSLLPAAYTDFVKDYDSRGKLYFKGNYEFNKGNRYSLKSNFGIQGAEIVYRPNSSTAHEVNLEGQLSMTEKESELHLNKVRLLLKDDAIEGQCMIRDFKKPYLELYANADVQLRNVFDFWPIDTVENIEGRLQFNTSLLGLVENLKIGGAGKTYSMSLLAGLKDMAVKFKGDAEPYKVPACTLEAVNGDIRVENLKLEKGQSRLSVSGSIPGLFKYLVDKEEPLIIRGSLNAPVIRMEDFLTTNSSGKKSSDEALIPKNMRFVLDAQIGQFSFGKFNASEIRGDIEIREQKAIINDVTLKAVEGAATVNAFVDNSKGRIDLTLQTQIENINIRTLFAQMNNFGQNTLQDKHIGGIGSATLDIGAKWSNQLVVDEKSIVADCDLVIERGELLDFEPMLAVSKFVSINELKKIRFNTMSSHVRINNRVITIPATHISNSALDIDFWGTHSFDYDIDYHIRLVISDLVSKKRGKKDDEFGPLESDQDKRRMAHILMTGNLDDPDIRYDKKGMKDKIRTDIRQEKQTLKKIMHKEFGLFKKDSIQTKPVKQNTFELENKNVPEKKPLELKKKPESDEDF